MSTHGWESATKADIKKLLERSTMPKRSKYGAQAVVIDGIRFDSKKEGYRYLQLKAMEKAGEICQLELQPRFELFVVPQSEPIPARYENCRMTAIGISVGFYVADFRYVLSPLLGQSQEDALRLNIVIEDVKSPATRTPLYRLKKRMVEACHGIMITEV